MYEKATDVFGTYEEINAIRLKLTEASATMHQAESLMQKCRKPMMNQFMGIAGSVRESINSLDMALAQVEYMIQAQSYDNKEE